MDGALVDERRIKVDFSNSVAKLWNGWRRKQMQKNVQQEIVKGNSQVPAHDKA
jgi:hypothetical protein